MYQVQDNVTNETFLVQSFLYVRRDENDVWQECEYSCAEAISVAGTLYALDEDTPVPGIEDAHTVSIREASAEKYIVQNFEITSDQSVTLNQHTNDISDTDEALLELAETALESDADLEEAVVELADAQAESTDDLEEALCEQSDYTEERFTDIEERLAALEELLKEAE